MCIYKLYGRLIGHEKLFVSGIFFHGNDIFNAKGAVQEYDMRFAELTKKIEGISYEYDADTTDLFTAFEAEEN